MRTTASRLAVLFAAQVLLAAQALSAERDAPSPAIAVIVGHTSFVTDVSKDQLRELYLRRQRLWPNGARAIPINLPPDSHVRERFARLVLGRSSEDLIAYWNARYFEGVTPPVVLPSASAVRAYLAAEPAAIAYLPVPDVDASCRVLLVLGE